MAGSTETLRPFFVLVDAGHLGRQLEGKTLALQKALELFCDFRIHARQDAVEEFDHRHLSPEACPHRAELEADDAGAHHHQVLGHLVESDGAGGRHHVLFVDVDALERGDVGAGGNDDLARLDDFRLAFIAAHLDLAGPEDAGGAMEGGDLVLLEQELDALGVAVDGVLLVGHQLGKVDLRGRDGDAHAGKAMARLGEKLGGMQKRLGGNAADIEAGAAMGSALFHHGHVHAELGGADGAHIASGAGADDGQIEGVGHGALTSP